jgi:transcription termination/antitermination protein NusA
MSKEILDVVKAVSYEMDVSPEIIFEAIETALAMATKKRHFADMDVKVIIDRNTGDYETFRQWTVVDEHDENIEFDANCHMTLAEALAKKPDAQLGDVIREQIESVPFGKRRAAQIAQQVITQKVREAKRSKIVEAYRDKIGQLITAVVKRTLKEGIILDLGDQAEAIIPRGEMLSGEMIRVGDRLRAYLYDIRLDAKGPQLYASRAHKQMLTELFKIEVPEIGEEVIEIKALAREPGVRSKIAVSTKDGRIDPVGACVGMRGARVQAISNELNGERIDIILWDDNPAQLAINALSPAEVASIVMDEDKKTMDIAVDESQLSQAIGRNGQNIRLASELTGWTLNVMSVEDAQKKNQTEAERIKQMFIDQLDIDAEIAQILTREGFATLEEIAYVPLQELLNISEFDAGLVQELRDRAKNILDKQDQNDKPAEDLLTMAGMTPKLAFQLARKGIKTMESLAECSVDELLDIEKNLTTEEASVLIMKAREPWFKDS